jgi:hypothetical protein
MSSDPGDDGTAEYPRRLASTAAWVLIGLAAVVVMALAPMAAVTIATRQ